MSTAKICILLELLVEGASVVDGDDDRVFDWNRVELGDVGLKIMLYKKK